MSMENPMERNKERMPSREEILGVMFPAGEKYTVAREEFDADGMFYLEAKTNEVNEEGETIEYQYIRKGRFEQNFQSGGVTIDAYYYKDGDFVDGEQIAEYDRQKGTWKNLRDVKHKK